MTYYIQDIIHGKVYKLSEGFKYELAVNLSNLDLQPFDLFCNKVIKATTKEPFDILITNNGDKICVYVVDVDKKIII